MAVALVQSKVLVDTDVSLASDTLDAGATAGNLLITTASTRWGASGPVGTFTPPAGYTLAFQIAPMQAHTAAVAYKVAAGGETSCTWTADGTFDGTAVGLYEYSGITSPVVDKTANAGSDTSDVSSIATGSTGTLGASVGLAFLVGLDRGAATGGTLSNDASMAEVVDFGVTGGATSYNECHAWKEFSSSTALNVTVSSTNTSKMGAGVVTFIADGGGGGGGTTFKPDAMLLMGVS